MNGFESCDDCGAARARLRMRLAAEIGDVINACGNACDALVIQRTPLPAVRNSVSKGANLVGTQALQMLTLAEENTHMRPEEFVSGTDEEIAIEVGDVNETVGAIVNGVDVNQRTYGVSEADDFFDRINRANGV